MMSGREPVRWAWAAVGVLLLLLLAACGGDGETTPDQATGGAGATTRTQDTGATATIATPQNTGTTVAPSGRCEEPATEISVGSPVSSEIVAEEQGIVRLYFCVEIPDGVNSVTFDLGGMTADLDLFVGYHDLETLQEGGIDLQFSELSGYRGRAGGLRTGVRGRVRGPRLVLHRGFLR